MEQQTNRSEQVVNNYRQHKMSASVYARIKELLMKFEADSAADRRMAWIGLGIALALVSSAAYFFASGSQITLT